MALRMDCQKEARAAEDARSSGAFAHTKVTGSRPWFTLTARTLPGAKTRAVEMAKATPSTAVPGVAGPQKR